MSDYKGLGKVGEDIAHLHLLSEGYRILDRNYRCKLGEIDIVAKDGKFLVFVEVKARQGVQFGYPREAVDRYKQAKLRNLASLYLSNKKLWENLIRFDVVEIIMETATKARSVEVIKNAF